MNESPKPKTSFWSQHELRMINEVEVFLHKPAIMKKAEHELTRLKDALVKQLAVWEGRYPDGTDLVKGQLARGENHMGFPFLSMDMPQKFSKTEMFTFRTLFWWGHYLGFALILKGKKLNQYLDRLLKKRMDSRWGDIYIASAETPWEWEWNAENFKNVSQLSADELQRIISSIQYIKLCRAFPVDEPSFVDLNWTETGVEIYKEMYAITLQK